MAEIQSKCKNCGEPFIITEGEQEWYAERKWELPKRCKDCRTRIKEKKKRESEEA